MTQCQFINNDLIINFIEDDSDVVQVYQFENGSEIEVIDDKIASIILPNFLNQVPFPVNTDTEVKLSKIHEIDDGLLEIQLDLQGQNINVKTDTSTLKRKVYI